MTTFLFSYKLSFLAIAAENTLRRFCRNQWLIKFILLLGKLVFSNAAKGAFKICGDIFPLGSGSNAVVDITENFVINITAYIANIFHSKILRNYIF